MVHNRKLVTGVADLVANLRLKVRDDIAAGSEVRDELEALLLSTSYFDNAPFKWVGLMLRYGLKNEEVPHYQGIDENDGELALAIELDAHELREADRDEFKRLESIATLKSLIHAGKKYGLPTQKLEDHLSDLCATRRYQETEKTDRGRPAGQDRKLVLSSSSLVAWPRFGVKDHVAVMEEVQSELEQILIDTEYLEAAPFGWVGLILRFGLANEEKPEYEPINNEYGDLPVAIEVDVNEFAEANRVEFKRLLTIATLTALIHVAERYDLPFEKLQKMLWREMGQV